MEGGADQLIGSGDMLLNIGSTTVRFQCAFVDTPEVEAVIKHISDQQGWSGTGSGTCRNIKVMTTRMQDFWI